MKSPRVPQQATQGRDIQKNDYQEIQWRPECEERSMPCSNEECLYQCRGLAPPSTTVSRNVMHVGLESKLDESFLNNGESRLRWEALHRGRIFASFANGALRAAVASVKMLCDAGERRDHGRGTTATPTRPSICGCVGQRVRRRFRGKHRGGFDIFELSGDVLSWLPTSPFAKVVKYMANDCYTEIFRRESRVCKAQKSSIQQMGTELKTRQASSLLFFLTSCSMSHTQRDCRSSTGRPQLDIYPYAIFGSDFARNYHHAAPVADSM
jgi:hypothetical protein